LEIYRFALAHPLEPSDRSEEGIPSPHGRSASGVPT